MQWITVYQPHLAEAAGCKLSVHELHHQVCLKLPHGQTSQTILLSIALTMHKT